MGRLDQAGGFGGPRIVGPQANVYTVLLLVACVFVAFALVVQVVRLGKLRQTSPSAPTTVTSAQRPGVTA